MTGSRPARLRLPRVLRRSLPTRLAAAFLTLSIATVLAATYVSYRSAETALRARLLERLRGIVDADARQLNVWVERQRSALEFTASLPITRAVMIRRAPTGDAPVDTALAGVLRRSTAALLPVEELQLLSVPGGRVIASTIEASVGTYAVDQRYYETGRDSTFTQPLYPSGVTGRPMLTIATPVRDATGRTLAVLAAHLDLGEMERILLKRSGAVPIDAYLVSAFAEFVSAERFGGSAHRRGVHSVGITGARSGYPGSGLYLDHEGRAVVGAWRWLPEHRLALLLEAPQDAAFAPARRLLLDALVVGLLASGLLAFGVVLILRRAMRPVQEVAAAAERLASGDFSTAAEVRSEDEAGQLAVSFNTMTQSLRTLYGELGTQVTATRAALESAQSSRALLQDVVEGTATIVLVIGIDGRVRLANARGDAALGAAVGASRGRLLADAPATAVGAALLRLVDDARTRDAAAERELELTTGDESHTWQTVAFPMRDATAATYAVGIIGTDLTERARAEEQRRQSDATVQQAQKLESLGIMAGGIAHDFNNILGSVLGNVELAQSAIHDRAEVVRALDQIGAAGRRAAELTRQMLAYAGRASLRRETIDVRLVIRDIVALVTAAQPKKVKFVTAPMPAPLWVEIDPAQFSQVSLNLLTNAAEAISDASGTVSLRAALSVAPVGATATSATGRWVVLTIEDTGPGMSDEVQRRIFEPFFTTKTSGRGLGLSAVNGILRSTGGVLQLRSRPGQGTRFDIFLPEAAKTAPARETAPAPAPVAARGSVLVIDDEAALRRICRIALERAGMQVFEAADGTAGLARFRERRAEISLVVLDLTMPGMSGAEVFATLRAEAPQLPVIIASGYDRSDRAASMPSDARTRFLQKPFGVSTLLSEVASVLA